MKIILKISMICGLLLSAFGTMQAARQDAPGVAIHKAMTGDFNASEAAQILADLPQEWKNQHRAIVRQIQNGTRGRGAVKKTVVMDPEKEDIDERGEDKRVPSDKEEISDFQKNVLNIKNFQPTDQDLEKTGKNEQRLVKEMAARLGFFIEKRYSVQGIDTWQLNKQFDEQYGLSEFEIKVDHYNKDYKSCIAYFNKFIRQFYGLEKDLGFSSYFNDFVECTNDLLSNLSELTSAKSDCLTLVETLQNWNKNRLSKLDKDNAQIFGEKLDEFTQTFGGEVVEKGKESTSTLINTMSNTLRTVIGYRYNKKTSSGLWGTHWGPTKQMNQPLSDYLVKTDTFDQKNSELINAFNAVITAIYGDVKDDKKSELVEKAVEACITFVQELKKYKDESYQNYRKNILKELEEWNANRVTHILNGADPNLANAINA